jgi:acetyl esterase/lipase
MRRREYRHMPTSAKAIFTAITRAFTSMAILVTLSSFAAASGATSTPAPAASDVSQSGLSSSDQQAAIVEVEQSRALVQSHFDQLTRVVGLNGAADLSQRFDDDYAALTTDSRPDGYPPADWYRRLATVARLDSEFLNQALSGKPLPLESAHGLVERLIVSNADGTYQPMAVYVPPSPGPHPALVVLLHGRPQTESQILGGSVFKELADSTQTIIVAPYGRGNYDYAPPAAEEVYQARDLAVEAFHPDPRKIFLAGYSMGGFSVFILGPMHASKWAGIMCISGSLVNNDVSNVLWHFQNMPVYVINGKLDDSIPARYGELTAAYLEASGIPVEFRQEPAGTHIVGTLQPSLGLAWSDMIAGVVRSVPQPLAGQLPALSLPSTSDDVKPP